MGLPSFIQGKILSTAVKKIADSEPRTTVLGFVLAGVEAAHIDYGKLLQKDPVEIGNAIGVVATALLGWYMNHKALVQTAPAPPPK